MKLAEDVLLTLTPKLKKTQHNVTLNIPLDIELTTYSGALIHILTNLINNALIHAFEESTQGTIDINASVIDESVQLEVRDNGIGIAEPIFDKIFTKFYTTKSDSGGSGLGLHICQKMAEEELQGDIRAENNKDKGSCFILRIKQHL